MQTPTHTVKKIFITFLFLAVLGYSDSDRVTNFYVSTDGNDSWSGRLAVPNLDKSDGPLATLEAARNSVRALKADTPLAGAVTVHIRAGKYTLNQPLSLGSEDSGSYGKEITYTAYQGEKPIISGGRRIENWKPYRGEILQSVIQEVKDGTLNLSELFYNGERQRAARYPNYDNNEPLYGGWAFVENVSPGTETTSFKYEPGTFPRTWSKPQQGQVVIFPWLCWVNDIVPIGSINLKEQTITFAKPLGHSQNNMPPNAQQQQQDNKQLFMFLMKGNRFYVQNLLEELDQPGEWCIDRETGTLYFWPPESLQPISEVTIPVIYTLIDIKGEEINPVQHISITGLTLTQTITDWPGKRNTSFHSPILEGHAIRLENAMRCTIKKNLIKAPGGDGIRLQGQTNENLISENEILQAGGMGISVTTGDVPGATHSWREKEELDASYLVYKKAVRNTFTQNRIHGCGVIKKNGGGIHFYGISSVDNIISENSIYDMPDKGITFQDGLGNVTVERNHLYDLALEIADTGAIMTNRWFTYTNDSDLVRGNIFRNNWIHDVKGCGAYGTPKVSAARETKAGGRIWVPYFAWGIYFDNSGMNATVQGNIVARTVLGGFGMPVGEPKNNIVENNIFLENSASQIFLRLMDATGFIFRNNIVYYTDPNAALFRLEGYREGAVAECDRNVYFNGGSELFRFQTKDLNVTTLDEWRNMGHDRNSVVADPLFMDLSKDDYRLKPDSPALKLGFRQLEKAGGARSPTNNP